MLDYMVGNARYQERVARGLAAYRVAEALAESDRACGATAGGGRAIVACARIAARALPRRREHRNGDGNSVSAHIFPHRHTPEQEK